jgi:hypothetical protein
MEGSHEPLAVLFAIVRNHAAITRGRRAIRPLKRVRVTITSQGGRRAIVDLPRR